RHTRSKRDWSSDVCSSDLASPTHPGRCCIRTPASRGTSQRSRKRGRRKKKPSRGKLTQAEKRTNRKLSRVRVKVEHALAGVKRRSEERRVGKGGRWRGGAY